MKKIDNVQEVTDRWQYIMLAVAIFLAIIFCCYYIIRQSRWGFYTAGGPVRQQANVLGADESTPSEVDGANDTGEMQPEKDETESDAEPEEPEEQAVRMPALQKRNARSAENILIDRLFMGLCPLNLLCGERLYLCAVLTCIIS